MKTVVVDWQMIRNNLKSNWKRGSLLLFICILCGLLVGLYQYQTYSPEKLTINDDLNQPIVLSDYPQGASQNYDIFHTIKTNADNIEVYYHYLMQISTSEESRIKIEDAFEAYDSFYSDEISKFLDSFKENPSAPQGFEDATIDYYERQAEKCLDGVRDEENRLKDVIEGSYTNDYKESFQSRVELSIARQKSKAKTFKEIADKLRNMNSIEMQKNREDFSNDAAKLAERINTEGDNIDELLCEISKNDGYELIYNKYLLPDAAFGDINEEYTSDRLGEAIIYARSVEGVDNRAERFWATMLFFVIFGITIAFLYGALYESKAARKTQKE